jgi:hypothetical protein
MLNVDRISIREPVQMKLKGSPDAGTGLKAMLLAAAAHRQAGTRPWTHCPIMRSLLTMTLEICCRFFRLVFSTGTVFFFQKKIRRNSVSTCFFSEANMAIDRECHKNSKNFGELRRS